LLLFVEKSDKKRLIMSIDPECGLEVNKKSAAAQTSFKGQNYFSCAEGCKEKLDRAPGKRFPTS